MISAALFCIFLTLLIYLLILLYKLRNYFKDRNVKYIEPMPFFGNAFDVLLGKEHSWEAIDKVYRAFPGEDILGFFNLINAHYVARSPEVVERVMVKDFSHFHDRIMVEGEIESPQDANIFILRGNIWRAVRHKFSPLFTSGKLKFMYNTMKDCGKNLEAVLDSKIGQELDMSDIMGLFAMDVIGSTAFGIEPNLLRNPNSKFREMGLKIIDGSFLINIRILIGFYFPKLANLLRLRGVSTASVSDYFAGVITHTMKQRKEGGIERNDFVQMLLQLKEKGKVEVQIRDSGDDYLMMDKLNDNFEMEMTDNILVGTALTFLTAGFHSTAMTLAFSLYELSRNPEVTERVREEIRESVKGDVPTYEELRNMPYLEKVLKEVLRLYPTAPVSMRTCTKECTFGNGLVIKPGELIVTPVMSIHLDPDHWPDPHRFDPERFQTPPKPGTYLAFGDGPRICIAMRFAMMEMKFALVILLKKYDFHLSSKTKSPLKIHPRKFLTTPVEGITFNVTKR